jgi:hypothetical protein
MSTRQGLVQGLTGRYGAGSSPCRVLLVAIVLLFATACRSERIVVEHNRTPEGHGYVPFARSGDPKVEPAGEHHPAPTVAIGPERQAGHAATP